MRKIALALLVLCIISQAATQDVTTEELANRVRAEFVHAWLGYKKYAWGHDAYKPLSKTSEDWYGVPFSITALEALDGLILMRLDEEADSTREYLATHLSFDRDVFVPTSEFAARVLGALISSYQLSADQRLLTLADDLGTRLLPAFISGTGMPYREVNLKTGAVRGEVVSVTDVGTLFPEFGALAMLTGKTQYYNHPKIALLDLYEHRSPLDLLGERIDINSGEWEKTQSHPGSGLDVSYVDILKCAYLFDDSDCAQMWQAYYAAINRYLLDSSATGFWYGQADIDSGKRTSTLLAPRVASFPAAQALFRDFGRAERTMESFHRLWINEEMEPDLYNYATRSIVKPGYALNPEICESAYTLYRTTANPVYLHMGKAILDSLILFCRTDEGYAALESVLSKKKEDHLDPWFFAGTLKYLYLLFASPDVLDFGRVFMNSHGHPIRKVW